MSCYNCQKSFSLLNREHGCKKCGFAFCSGCLKFKLNLPDATGKISEKSVCASCHQRVTQPESSKMIRPPPDALLKRLESLESPVHNPITVYSTKMDRLKKGLSKEDAQIAERLQKLQSDRKKSPGHHGLPSDQEMAKRLAMLKGEDPTSATESPNILKPKPAKSDVEQTHDLMAKLVDEVKLDQRVPKPEDEIAERLAKLRGQEYQKPDPKSREINPEVFLQQLPKAGPVADQGKTPIDIQNLLEELSRETESDANRALESFEGDENLQKQLEEWRKTSKSMKKGLSPTDAQNEDNNDDDDEEEASKLAQQVLAEAALEKDDSDDELESGIPAVPSKNLVRQIERAMRLSDSDCKEDELPWCNICNEDANLRCYGCDGDLYCSRCFRECHQEDVDLRDHKTAAYKAPKKSADV